MEITENTSDGYHTFKELYEHRMVLFAAFLYQMHDLYALEQPSKYKQWRSKKHADGTMFDGMFIVGMGIEPGSQITYHYDIEHWDLFDFVEELESAPEFDGHTSDDVLNRIKAIQGK